MSNGAGSDARSRFLYRSTKLLEDCGPTVAGALRIHELSFSSMSLSKRKRHSAAIQCCGICGSKEIEQRTVPVHTTKILKQRHEHQHFEKNQIVLCKCKRCGRTEKFPNIASVPDRVKPSTEQVVKVSETPRVDAMDSASTNTPMAIKQSSKKRAKARKDREGLQALLKRGQADSEPTNRLSLRDFMSHAS